MPVAVIFYRTLNRVQIEVDDLEDAIATFRRWNDGDESVSIIKDDENIDQDELCDVELYAEANARKPLVTCTFTATDPFRDPPPRHELRRHWN